MKGIKQAILLGIFFMILVSTYISFSFIVTYMYQHRQDGSKQMMGPVLLFTNYIVFLISNSFAPSIRLTHKTQMKIAALCYAFNYIAEALMLPGGWGISSSIIGAMVGGFGAAILWVSYGSYMKTLCQMYNQQQIQGSYFAISNGITFSSLLLGPIITTFCFQLFSSQVYFIVLSAIGFISFAFCSIFVQQVQKKNQSSKEYDCLYQLVKCFKYYKQMTAIIPALVLDGLILGFVSTSSTNLMPGNSQRVQIGIFLIILGFGCILGGFFSGYFSDLVNTKNSGKLAFIIAFIVSFITLLLSSYTNKAFAYICAFLWGIARQYIQGWLYVACSINYNGKLESYANMKQLHSFSFCIYQTISIVTQLKLKNSYYMILFMVTSPICFYFINRLPYPIDNQKQLEQINRQYESPDSIAQ